MKFSLPLQTPQSFLWAIPTPPPPLPCDSRYSSGQFYRNFTYEFLTKVLHAVFCTYTLGLYFFVARMSAQKLLKKMLVKLTLWSISPTFYECICTNILAPKIVQTWNVRSKELCAKLSYKRGGRKMLVNLTQGGMGDPGKGKWNLQSVSPF